VPRLTTVTRAEELAAKVRRFALLDMDRPGATPGNHRREAADALSELVADAEALAEALEPLLGHAERIGGSLEGRGNDEYFDVRTSEFWNLRHAAQTARDALARYRGEK
jgi:hypothetical protein